jgi:branched-chain amino acid aminotransferase
MFLAKDLVKRLHPNPPKFPGEAKLGFGEYFTPHMFEVDAKGAQWGAPLIHEFGMLSIPPQCTALHYGIECFEGLKAYRDKNGDIRLFRPDMNLKRLQSSMQRLCLPAFDERELLQCLKQLVLLDHEWIPRERGNSLYIRPTAIGTNKNLRVGPSDECKLFIICSPVGSYYPEGFKPVKLLVDGKNKRSWPGGTGGYKLGCNYAGPIYHQVQCAKQGYSQVLWLGPGYVVDEVGAMNFMLLWKNQAGERELITAPLDGTILPGVTRDSILQLMRKRGDIKVSEKRFTVHDMIEALNQGRVEEMFGCGTAAIVSAVNGIRYKDVHYAVPCPTEDSVAKYLLDTIMSIQYGEVESEWSIVVRPE